jgi:hypothetical protein
MSWLKREPDLLVHVIFMSANLGTWDGCPSRATTHLSTSWRTNFAPEGVANWFGACFWGGFLAFIGVAHRGARDAFATECERIEKRTLAALPRLNVSGRGSGAMWVSG